MDTLHAYGATDTNGKMAQELHEQCFRSQQFPHCMSVSTYLELRETGLLNVNTRDSRVGYPHQDWTKVLNMVADTPSTSMCRVRYIVRASHTVFWQVTCQQQVHSHYHQKVTAVCPADSSRQQEFSQ
jgi:hypothetical protein